MGTSHTFAKIVATEAELRSSDKQLASLELLNLRGGEKIKRSGGFTREKLALEM